MVHVNEPQELSDATCRSLLTSGIVGRVGVCTASGPGIFTVNYAVVDDAIVFRTSPDGVLGTHANGSRIAFQVDHVDYEYHRGWGVLATGRSQVLTRSDDLEHVRAVWDPRPWVGGSRELYVLLAWDELSGRQLGGGWNPRSRLPVCRTAAAAVPRSDAFPDWPDGRIATGAYDV